MDWAAALACRTCLGSLKLHGLLTGYALHGLSPSGQLDAAPEVWDCATD